MSRLLDYAQRPRRRDEWLKAMACAVIVTTLAGLLLFGGTRLALRLFGPPQTAAEAIESHEQRLKLPDGVSLVYVDAITPDFGWEMNAIRVRFDDTGHTAWIRGSRTDWTTPAGDDIVLTDIAHRGFRRMALVDPNVTAEQARWSYGSGLNLTSDPPFVEQLGFPITTLTQLRDRQKEVLAAIDALRDRDDAATWQATNGTTIKVRISGPQARLPSTVPATPIQ
jgi:hypothetical protein